MSQPVSEGSHVDRVYNLTKVVVAEKYGICFVVAGECANSDVIGWTGGGETEELSCLGGGKDENVTPRVVVRVSRVSEAKSFDMTQLAGGGKVKMEHRDWRGNIKGANMRVVNGLSRMLPSDGVVR